MYGGFGGSNECKYEFMRCTKVVLPDPAIPIVMITLGFRFDVDEALAGAAAAADVEAIVVVVVDVA